jgi:hypothetical protein
MVNCKVPNVSDQLSLIYYLCQHCFPRLLCKANVCYSTSYDLLFLILFSSKKTPPRINFNNNASSHQRLLVQSWISANPRLKYNIVFRSVYFYISMYFKTLENKTSKNFKTYKLYEKIFPFSISITKFLKKYFHIHISKLLERLL